MFLLAKEFGLASRHAVISGSLYMFGFLVTLFFKGSSIMVLAYAFCPLILFLTMSGVRKRSLWYGFGIGLSTCLFAGINPPETIIALAPSLLYLFMKFVEGKNWFVMKFFLVVSAVAFAVNLFWIFPAYNSLSTGWSEQIWVETPTILNKQSSYPEIFRQLGYWGFYDNYKGVYYFPFAPYFIQNAFWVLVSFVVPVLSLLAIMTKRIRQSKYLVILILLIVAIPLAVGAYPPSNPGSTGTVYLWLYNNVPYFMSFRNSYKFVFLISLAYSLLIGVFFESFECYLRKAYGRISAAIQKKRNGQTVAGSGTLAGLSRVQLFKNHGSKELFFKLAVSAIGISVVMVSYWPTWTGYIQDDKTSFEVPSYYDDVSQYFADKGDSRILLTPYRYFFPYEWGLLSAEVMSSKVQNPLLYNNVGKVGSDPAGDALGQYLTSSIYSNDTAGVSILFRYLGVDYVVQQNDINYTYYDSNSQTQMKNILQNIPSLEKVETFGKVDIYKVKSPSGIIEAVDQFNVSPLNDNQSIDPLIIQKVLAHTDHVSNRTVKEFAYLNSTIAGDSVIKVTAMIRDGTNLSVVLYSDQGTYYVFQASSNTSGENGIDRYDNGTSVQHSTNNAVLCQKNQLINLSVVINGNSARLLIDGIDAADQVLANYTGREFHVGFASWNSTALFRSLEIHNSILTYSQDFQVSKVTDLKNWTIQGKWWNIFAFPIQALDYAGDVPLFISKEYTVALEYLNNVTLVRPTSLSYDLVDPVRTEVNVSGATGPFLLLMKSTWGDWRASIDGKEIDTDYHVRANGYCNAWIVNTTGNFTIVLTYQPYQDFTIGFSMTLAVLVSIPLLVLASLILGRYRRNKKLEKV